MSFVFTVTLPLHKSFFFFDTQNAASLSALMRLTGNKTTETIPAEKTTR